MRKRPHDGRYMMLFRSHRRNGRSIIGLAESDDGCRFRVRPQPFLVPADEGVFAEYEEYGVEDCRISAVEGAYLLTYSAYSRYGVRIGLARTRDFESVERIALITQADTRNIVIFPEKIDGRYVRLDRPHSHIGPWSIWISDSPDLVHWGDSRWVIKPATYHWTRRKLDPGRRPSRLPTAGWRFTTAAKGQPSPARWARTPPARCCLISRIPPGSSVARLMRC